MLSNILDRISFWALFFVIVLLPVFFLPFTKIPIETSKGFLLVFGLVVSIIFWAAARFSDGKITLPKSYVLLSVFGIVLVFLVSAIFSGAPKMSFFGLMFDISSFYFIFSAFILMLMSSIVLKYKENAKLVLLGVILSSSIVFIFQIFRFFMPNLLSLGILGGKTDNLVGSWNTLGILAGLSVIISLLLIEFFNVNKKTKWLLGILMTLAILITIAVNYSLVWKFLGIFALLIFVFKISFSTNQEQQEGNRTHFSATSFAVMMISLLFFMSGQFIGGYIPGRLGLQDLEVSPSFTSTMSVAKKSLMKDPILGIGPNRFDEVWSMYKPSVINQTVFWNTSFSTGFGLLPTLATTTGSLGILSWLVFLFLLISSGIKTIFSSIKKGENSELALFFFASLYLFTVSIFYSTGVVIFLLAFAFTGVFIGVSTFGRPEKEISMSFLDDPRKSFFSILFLVILMIVSAATSFKYVERLASVSYFGKTISAQDITTAESSIKRAVVLHTNDLYLRTYSQVYLTKLNALVAKGESLTEAEKTELQANFDQAVNGAILATQYNTKNYLNFQALGSVYSTVASFGQKEAYGNAVDAYKQASLLNPLNPSLKLAIANLFFVEGKTKEAREAALEAFSLKPDYIDLLITLSQIEKKDGNNALAISYGERALQLSPTSKDLSQYVNSLKGINVQNTTNNTTKTTE